MKKLLSLLLSLAMLCALTAPALAYDPADDLDPPLWEQWGYRSYEQLMEYSTPEQYEESLAYETWKSAYVAAHPVEFAAFDAYAYFSQSDYSQIYDGPEGYMDNYRLTREEFERSMETQWLYGLYETHLAQAEWDDFCAEKPERTAQFLAELDGWFREEYPWYDSLQEYCGTYSQSLPETYLELFGEWDQAYEYERELQAGREAYLTERGGVPGQVNVMVDGQCLAFPAGRLPYLEGGTLFADADTLSAALGMDIPAPLTGWTEVRSAAAKAGYEVYWDRDFDTAVLMDRAALTAAIDEDFTILNGALSALAADPEKCYRDTGSLKLDVTLFNSLDGDEKYSVTANYKALRSSAGCEASVSASLGALADQLFGGIDSSWLDEEQLAQVDALTAALKKMDAACYVDWGDETIYFSSPLMSVIADLAGAELAEDAWLSLPFAYSARGDALTMGALACLKGLDTDQTPVYYYDACLEEGANLAQFLGDGCWTRRGADRTTELDLETLAAMAGWAEMDLPYGYGLPREFSLTLTVKSSGALTGRFTFRTPDLGYYSSADSRTAAEWSLSPASRNVTVEYHAKNQCKLVLTVKIGTSVTNDRPDVAPPAGATVIPAEELGS